MLDKTFLNRSFRAPKPSALLTHPAWAVLTRSSIRFPFAMALTFLALAFLFLIPNLFASSFNTSRCKYSVRDVAFVNVHGKSWQLQLVRPADVDASQFEAWNQTLRKLLEPSNVGFAWHANDSAVAKRIMNQQLRSNAQLPTMALAGPNESLISVDAPSGSTFSDQIDLLVHSPKRTEILDRVVDALCVVVLVESDDEKTNGNARKTTANAIARLEGQMWTLEKPTDKGPVLVTVSKTERENENWLLRSLGIENDQLPAVAIVYGQGRRLGEVLTGEAIQIEKIVGRASVCGQDCECDLNRDWLYGRQMVHAWSKSYERAAEQSLTFDPKSAFVIAEVAQIIQKNSTGIASNDRVDLGGGLVIHDLDPIENQNDKVVDDSKRSGTNPQTPESNSAIPQMAPEQNANPETSVGIPWILIIVLAAIGLLMIILSNRKSGQAS